MMQRPALKYEEQVAYDLRTLYAQYGYAQYKMSKFEEYDLYARNKDFLVSDSILTFTDLSGRLMALKPDVTLSIVRSTKDVPGYAEKVYYNENVYRAGGGANAFREIMQVGLECIGAVDDYCLGEVLMLAAESLRRISPEYVLSISHLGVLAGVLDGMALGGADRAALLRCIGEKNLHELAGVCEAAGVPAEQAALLRALVTASGAPEAVLPKLRALLPDCAALDQLEGLVAALADYRAMLRIDLSVVGNMRYYNGVVFKGFVSGVPSGVLSGGQYDRLLQKMGRGAKAVGFAVYLDLLELLEQDRRPFDVDAVLLYDADADPAAVRAAVRALTGEGLSVMAQRAVPEKIRCRKLWKLEESGVRLLEDHA